MRHQQEEPKIEMRQLGWPTSASCGRVNGRPAELFFLSIQIYCNVGPHCLT